MKLAITGPVLPTDSDERKEIPLFSGVMNYFPLALAAVARVSKRGNDKHNPGEPLHWARGKSMDHCDCIARHLIDVETLDPKTNEYEDAQAMAWRALAKLEELEEKRLGKPISRGSRVETLILPAEAAPAFRWSAAGDTERRARSAQAPVAHDGYRPIEPRAFPHVPRDLDELEPAVIPHTASDFKPGPV